MAVRSAWCTLPLALAMTGRQDRPATAQGCTAIDVKMTLIHRLRFSLSSMAPSPVLPAPTPHPASALLNAGLQPPRRSASREGSGMAPHADPAGLAGPLARLRRSALAKRMRASGGWLLTRRQRHPGIATAAKLGLLLLLPLAQMPSAHAGAARYALACVGTETGYTVNFSYRWGSEGWRQMSVAPGKWIKLYWTYEYAGQNRSPTLTIRYDDDLTNRSNFVRTDLKAYAAEYLNCEDQGKTYNFYTRGDELYVQEED